MSGRARSIHTFCPSCGGTVNRSERTTAEQCAYCGHRSIVVTDELDERRYALHPNVDAAEAARAARSEVIRTKVLPSRLAEGAHFDKPMLYFIPFLWLTGSRPYLLEQKVSLGGDLKMPDTKVVIEDFEFFEPAVEIKGWGLKTIDIGAILSRQTTPMPAPFEGTELRKQGLVIVPQRGFEELSKQVDTRSRTVMSQGEPPERIAERRRILYFPLWVVNYTVRGQRYEARIDGLGGELISARGPEDHRSRAPMALVVLFLPGFIVGKVLRVVLETMGSSSFAAFFHPGIFITTLLFSLFGVFILLSCMGFAWSLLNYEAEHHYRSGQIWFEQLGRPDRTWLDRLALQISRVLSSAIKPRNR